VSTHLPQVRRWHGGLLVGDRGRPRTGHSARAGRSDAGGGRADVQTGRVPVRPDVSGTAWKWTSGVPDVHGHGVPVRKHTGRRRELQRAEGKRRLRRLQRGQ